MTPEEQTEILAFLERTRATIEEQKTCITRLQYGQAVTIGFVNLLFGALRSNNVLLQDVEDQLFEEAENWINAAPPEWAPTIRTIVSAVRIPNPPPSPTLH